MSTRWWGANGAGLGLLAGVVVLGLSGAAAASDLRVSGLASRPPDPILLLVVRGEGVKLPVIALQDRARDALEGHVHARVVSQEEAFVRTGADLQKRLIACRGEDRCYAELAGGTDAAYALVLVIDAIGDETLVGCRFIDLAAARAIGTAADTVPERSQVLGALDRAVQRVIPAEMWDPYGQLRFEIDADGAEVTVEGRVVGVTPLPRLGYLLPGTYTVGASKLGHQPAQAKADVRRGEESTVRLSLPPESSGLAWWVWALIGTAVVAGGATAAVLASSGGDPSFCSSPDPAACD